MIKSPVSQTLGNYFPPLRYYSVLHLIHQTQTSHLIPLPLSLRKRWHPSVANSQNHCGHLSLWLRAHHSTASPLNEGRPPASKNCSSPTRCLSLLPPQFTKQWTMGSILQWYTNYCIHTVIWQGYSFPLPSHRTQYCLLLLEKYSCDFLCVYNCL